MRPSFDEIQRAAYLRWEARGYGHGHHESDWTTAEESLLFSLNYRWVYRSDSGESSIGDPRRRVCRFCEQAEPRTSFSDPTPALPDWAGLPWLRSFDQCDECSSGFRDGIDTDAESFVRLIQKREAIQPVLPPAALKGMTRAALSLVPTRLLDLFPDAVEWVSNPDHDLDSNSLHASGCVVHRLPRSHRNAWAAVAQRFTDDLAAPTFLAFFGIQGITLELPIPFCHADEEFEGERLSIPKISEIPELASADHFLDWSIPAIMTAARPAPRFPRVLF